MSNYEAKMAEVLADKAAELRRRSDHLKSKVDQLAEAENLAEGLGYTVEVEDMVHRLLWTRYSILAITETASNMGCLEQVMEKANDLHLSEVKQ